MLQQKLRQKRKRNLNNSYIKITNFKKNYLHNTYLVFMCIIVITLHAKKSMKHEIVAFYYRVLISENGGYACTCKVIYIFNYKIEDYK